MNRFGKALARLMGIKSTGGQISLGTAGQGFTLSDADVVKLLRGGGTSSGKIVNDTTAMQVTTAFACVRVIAETMGAMPSCMYIEQKSGNIEKAPDHPLVDVLVHQPNADMNGHEYRETCAANLAARGNSLSLIERRGNGDVLSLYPVPWSQVTVKRDRTTNYQMMYGIYDRGKRDWYPAEKVWHRKLFSFDGLIGLSPISVARQAIGLALAGEEYNANLFRQGLLPSAIVKIPNWLTDDQREIANKKLNEMHLGSINSGKPFLLEGDMTIQDGLFSPDDAQFLQLRQFEVVELCRLFGVKPHMVAALEQATDNNIEQLSLEFVTYTMNPYMVRDQVAVNKLLKPGDRGKFAYHYDFKGLLLADSAARGSLYSILLQNGVRSRNEVRGDEGLNRVDDPAMDAYTVQSNMALIDQLAQLVSQRMQPKP